MFPLIREYLSGRFSAITGWIVLQWLQVVTCGYMWLQGDTLPHGLGMVARCDERTYYDRMHLFHTTNPITESRYHPQSSDYLLSKVVKHLFRIIVFIFNSHLRKMVAWLDQNLSGFYLLQW